jgi:hypothetical protein
MAAAQNENGPDHLLARGKPGGDVEELLHGLWLITANLMHQGSAVRAGPERQDGIGVTDFGDLMTLSRETPDVVPQGFTLLLSATVQIPGVTRPQIRAQKVVGEDLLEILPTID